MLPQEALDAVRKSPLFAGLGELNLRKIQAKCHMCDFERGATLFVQGTPANHLFLVIEGWIAIKIELQAGESTVIHVIGPGEIIAAPAALHFRRFPATAEAATETLVVEIPVGLYRDLVTANPEFALAVIAGLSARLHNLGQDLGRRQLLSTQKRVASFLLDHAPTKGAAVIKLPYEKGLIAARLGMEPQTFSRALSLLGSHGVHSKRGCDVIVDDVAALRRYLESEE